MKKKRSAAIRYLLGGVIFQVLISACVSTPDIPGWIERYPTEREYFIGIGSSNTGNRADDADLAREEALANLAGAISTTIISEVELERSDSSSGAAEESIRQRINETVFQIIEGAEVVDSYSSPKDGYWIYMRFPKKELERQKSETAARVIQSAAPVYASPAPSDAEALSLLQKAHAILIESPYFASLRGDFAGGERVLIDQIEEESASILGRLELDVEPGRIEGEAGSNASLALVLAGSENPGRMPLSLLKDEQLLSGGRSDADGSLSIDLDLSRIPVGRGELAAQIDLEALGIDPAQYLLALPRVMTTIPYRVAPLPVVLIVDIGSNVETPGVREMAAELFSGNDLPFSLSDAESAAAAGTEYIFRCRLIVEDFPKYKDNSLEISQARLVLQTERVGGEVLYTFESDPMKDGGLTLAQAHERTIKKLFAKLDEEKKYLDGVIESLPISR